MRTTIEVSRGDTFLKRCHLWKPTVCHPRLYIQEAEGKAWETFCSNIYVFDKFFGRAITPLDESAQSEHEANYIDNYFKYAATQPALADFAGWLKEFEQTEKFKRGSEDFIALQKRLDTTSDFEARGYLIKAKNQLESLFKVEKQED